MPLAIIDGVLGDKAGLPTAQLVAAVTGRYEVGQDRSGVREGGGGMLLGHWELRLLVGGAMGLTREEASTEGVKGSREGRRPT